MVLWHWSWKQLSPRHRASQNLAGHVCGRKTHKQCADMAQPSECHPTRKKRCIKFSCRHPENLRTDETTSIRWGPVECHCRCCRHAAHKGVAIKKTLHHSSMWKVVVDGPKAVLHALRMSGDGKSSILSSLTISYSYKLLQQRQGHHDLACLQASCF